MQNISYVKDELITLTPEYLYKEGIKYYSEAVETANTYKVDLKSENNNTNIIEKQEVYAKAMLYLQGAMFLDSSDASNFLIKIYNESEINK